MPDDAVDAPSYRLPPQDVDFLMRDEIRGTRFALIELFELVDDSRQAWTSLLSRSLVIGGWSPAP